MKTITYIALLSPLLSSLVIAKQDSGYRSIEEITSALNPLEVIANHDGIRRSIDLNIQFSLNSAEILPTAERQIAALGNALSQPKLAECQIIFTGHTDATGNTEQNKMLSKQRAFAVQNRLIKQFGFSDSRFLAIGKGSDELIPKLAINDAKHRRVTIELANIDECKQQAKQSVKALEKREDGDVKIDW